MKPSGQNLSAIVFDLDYTLTNAEFKDEMWARTIDHIRVVPPRVDGDELRRRASAARDVHYAEVLAGTMGLDTFRRTQLADAAAPWGQLPETTAAMCLSARGANLERWRLLAGARELIDRLRATGSRVGVLTNGPSELQRHKLAVTGSCLPRSGTLVRWCSAGGSAGRVLSELSVRSFGNPSPDGDRMT